MEFENQLVLLRKYQDKKDDKDKEAGDGNNYPIATSQSYNTNSLCIVNRPATNR